MIEDYNKNDPTKRHFFRRKKTCPFSMPNSPKIDYKDVKLLNKYVTERGKIIPSRISAISAIFGSLSLSICIQGWLMSKLLLIERLGYIIVTFCLLSVSFTTDLIGFVILIVLVLFHYFEK